MENKKLIILFSLFLSLTFSSQVFGYEIGTHAYLTDEIVNFYNNNFSGNKISNELTSYLIDGSRREDDVPRWMNHFYDPVNNRGLSYDPAIDPAINLGTWEESRDWASDENNQKQLTYKVPATIASILTAFEQRKLSEISSETDFTWQRAIDYWIKGEKEKAMFVLGHILHLIEDASVPDHTRNDPHPGDSPYEKWTSKFTLENPDSNLAGRLLSKKPFVLDNLNSYFDAMANYSNNNFYSKDTIGIQSGYKLPEPQYTQQIGDYIYGFNKDEDGDFKLFIKEKNSLLNTLSPIGENINIFIDKDGGDVVIKDYWSRLSVKAVQHGAGVVDLFFKEVGKAQNDPNFVKEEPKSVLAQVADTVRGFFANLTAVFKSKDDLKLAAEIDLENNEPAAVVNENEASNANINNTNEIDSNIRTDVVIDEQDEDAAERVAQQKQQKTTDNSQQITTNLNSAVSASSAGLSGVGQGEATFKQCVYNVSQAPKREKLILNEVAWMGGPLSANDEWLEVKNISGGELDISGWQVLDKSEQIKITFPAGTKLAADGLMLLERTDDDSVPGVAADAIYTGALSNVDEGLRLFDKDCALVDEVLANPDWPAGESTARKTMERSADLSWHTYSRSGESLGGQTIMGTPKKENSASSSDGGGSNPPAQPESPAPLKILISEMQTTGGTGQADNEFIELYNPNDLAIDLSALPLKLHIRNSSGTDNHKPLTFINTTIPGKGYFLVGPASGYTGTAALDATYSASSGNKLVNNGGAYISKSASADTEVLDKVGWGTQPAGGYETAPYPENPIANQSISRQSENDSDNNAVDFIKSKPTPKGPFEQWSQAVIQTNHLVISEVYPDRTGANLDFVELYNPNATATPDIDISGWSLQVLSANATSTEKIAKKNFEAGNKIPSRGFFLIGIDNYPVADMNWLSGSLNSTSGATIFLVSGTTTISDFEDARIVDQIAYDTGAGLLAPETQAAPLPVVGQSLERKAFQNSNCVSAQNNGEFLGNGCDTDNNESDFEVRQSPKPQGRNNLFEPREAPPVPENFTAEYSSLTLQVILNWSGATSTNYFLNYGTTSPAELKTLATAAATTTYLFGTKEVGVNYYFAITVKDSENLASTATTTLNVPSSLANLYFYKDTRSTTSKKYLFDLYYDEYPFIPNTFDNYSGTTGRILVFYLNKEAPTELGLNTANNWQPKNLDHVLAAFYPRCAGDGPTSVGSPGFSLILPGPCGNGGGVANSTMHNGLLEDLHLLLALATTTDKVIFTDQDFVTVGMYSFCQSGGGSQGFCLVALDRKKYYFQTETPEHQPPQLDGELEVYSNMEKSQLETKWQKAVDTDTLDSLITYEINYSTSTQFESWNWQRANWGTEDRRQVAPGDSFSIGVRAKDDFGNYSDILTAEWSYPETTFYIEQNQANNWLFGFGTRNPNGGLDTASYQSIQSEEDLEFNTVVLRLRQEVASDSADIQLSVYPDLNNRPDFDSLIADTQLKGMYKPDPNLGIAFIFDEPVELMAGDKYWLVLSVKKYSDSRGYYRNQWQNAINTGIDLYVGGQAGIGPSKTCNPQCVSYGPSTYIPYPDATADWYMKIGLAEY